jgi:23S rRNA pseudouridine955/2504/2580 synthase
MAKNRETAQQLTSLFRLRKVHKTYLAVCHGELEKDSGEWNNNLVRYENNKKIIEKAKTFFKVIDKNSNFSLVEMKPITGRKHQLRKQLFNIGHSIYGDQKYKSSDLTKGINKNLMLHSYQIRFIMKDKKFTYKALLPDYFKKVLLTKRLNFSNLK